MSEFEDRMMVPTGTYRAQEEAIRSGRLAWAVMSGKMTSGKDTVAPLLVLPEGAVVSSYGDLIREEMSIAIPHIRSMVIDGTPEATTIRRVSGGMNLSEEIAEEIVRLLASDFREDIHLTPRSRTDNMRYLLQNLGSDWRTADDEDYWARRGAIRAMEIIGSGKSVVAAGSRFLPDVEIPRLEGGFTVRLDVSRETQLRRLKSRDGLMSEKTLKALDHPGETCLDDFDHDIRVNNDDEGEYALSKVVETLNRHITELMKERTR